MFNFVLKILLKIYFNSKEMVKLIQKNNESKKTVETDFILAHNLYARAEIPPTDKVKHFIFSFIFELFFSNK